jgi:hypothetical protein
LHPRVLKKIPDLALRVDTRASSSGRAPSFPTDHQIRRWTTERRDLKAVLDNGPDDLKPGE